MNQTPSPPLDLLAVGAHPDDAELFAGGTLALLARRGWRVGIMALTRGEGGTRGTPEIRRSEAESAARVLDISPLRILDLGDCRLENSDANRRAVAAELRAIRPQVVMTHNTETRHPDHRAAHDLVRDACFFANVGGYDAGGERHQVRALVYFLGHDGHSPGEPDWICDIGETREAKIAAMKAYSSQFRSPETEAGGPQTFLTSGDFWENQERTWRRWGARIGAEYGEPFLFASTPHADHPFVAMMTRDAPAR